MILGIFPEPEPIVDMVRVIIFAIVFTLILAGLCYLFCKVNMDPLERSVKDV